MCNPYLGLITMLSLTGNFIKFLFLHLSNVLSNVDWDCLLSYQDAEVVFNFFFDKLTGEFNMIFPVVYMDGKKALALIKGRPRADTTSDNSWYS